MIEVIEKGVDRSVNFQCRFCGTKFCSDEYRIIGPYCGAWKLATECPICKVGVEETVVRRDGRFVPEVGKVRNK